MLQEEMYGLVALRERERELYEEQSRDYYL